MPITRANGIKIHTLRRGAGADVVMVHGLAANLAFWWYSVVPAISNGFQVTAFDLRGHGRSETPSTGYSVADHAADLVALLDVLGIERAHVVGHSFGGEVALQVAVRHPARVRSVTLADARVRCVQPVNRLDDWPRALDVRRDLQRAAVDIDGEEPEAGHKWLESAARGRRDLVHTLGGDPDAGAKGFGAWGERSAQQWLRLLDTTSARTDFTTASGPTRGQLRRLQAPVLAVYGEWSPCLPSMRGVVRLVPSCRPYVVRRAGHFHPMTHPRLFTNLLRSHLGTLERRDHAANRRRWRARPGPRAGRRPERSPAWYRNIERDA